MYNAIDLKLAVQEGKLSGRDLDFARSLIQGAETYGASEKQAYWINKLVARAKGEDQKPAAPALPKVDIASVLAMFQTAKDNGLKAPRIRLQGFTLTLAKDVSQNAGQVYVKTNDGIYCGKIAPTGEYRRAHGIGALADTAAATVTAFAADPLASATAYGQLTNNCCFCGLTLTDDDSRARGYGPICARRFGLEHTPARKGTAVSVNKQLKVKVS